jgi:hypothetical protein
VFVQNKIVYEAFFAHVPRQNTLNTVRSQDSFVLEVQQIYCFNPLPVGESVYLGDPEDVILARLWRGVARTAQLQDRISFTNSKLSLPLCLFVGQGHCERLLDR